MTEDTSKWATANAGTPAQLASGTADFNVAQKWENEAQRKGRQTEPDASKEEFSQDLKKVSPRQA